MSMINSCPECHHKDEQIIRLQEELARVKGKLRYQERTAREGFFGSSTPSSKVPAKANTPGREKKPRGGKLGHAGHGRPGVDGFEARRVEDISAELPKTCPGCGGALESKGEVERLALESRPVRAERVVYRQAKGWCPHCRKTFRSPIPLLPKSLLGNQLCANAVELHYAQGMPLLRVSEELGVEASSLAAMFQRLARLFSPVRRRLIEEYRAAPVRHADETGWRSEGQNGYAWLFATPQLSLFEFRETRSGQVAREILGETPLPGVLVVDRYGGYNKVPCALQYCYAHLLRDVQDCEKEFPEEPEVKAFVATVAPLLALAMGLRNQLITDAEFQRRAQEVKSQIEAAMHSEARHSAVHYIQGIFREHEARLYHWARDRTVPAENNLSERDLRPTVIARKVSHGSQSAEGRQTRGILGSVVATMRKRGLEVTDRLKWVLDQLAADITQAPYPLLFS